MRSLMTFALAAVAAASVRPKTDHWAILVSGSNGYGNYRHHADTCHAYQLLVANGIPEDHIITFLYDDVANDPSNPFPGTLYNQPTDAGVAGVDVYEGCKKSYTGQDVTPANFLAVLTGNVSAVQGGSGEVLKSGPNSFVFWAFFDHGASGLVAFPAGGYLYRDDLWAALETANNKRMWKQLTVYMEACESGSMFEGYPTDRNVYITTASNPDESSWGTYCPPQDTINGTELGTCLGDLYSVNWLQNAEQPGNVVYESLQEQYTEVQTATNLSHVMQYGETDWTDEPIGDFLGNLSKTGPSEEESQGSNANEYTATYGEDSESAVFRVEYARRMASRPAPAVPRSSWDSRLATLTSLQLRAARAVPGSPMASRLHAELRTETARVARWDATFSHFTRLTWGAQSDREAQLSSPAPAYISWTESHWACYKQALVTMESSCDQPLGDYGLRYARLLAQACHNGDAVMTRGTMDWVLYNAEQACRVTQGLFQA